MKVKIFVLLYFGPKGNTIHYVGKYNNKFESNMKNQFKLKYVVRRI